MFRLPVSQVEVEIVPPTGVEDLLLLEIPGAATELALDLVSRLVQVVGGSLDHWLALPVADLEALLLLIRRSVFGDRIRAEARCTTADCGARIDVDFSVDAYLAHHTPHTPRNVPLDGTGADGQSWRRLHGTDVRFRLPVVADRLAAARSPNPAVEIARRCIQPPELPAAQRRRVEKALAALAPSFSHELEGSCPDCGARLVFYFDVQEFTLAELRDQAQFILDDIHLIAATYHWAETDILALPRSRRISYAERIRRELTQE